MKDKKVIFVSMCLLGINCRYDGKNNKNNDIINLINNEEFIIIPICPEQLGGLSTPRDPSEILGEKVVSNKNKDVSANFKKGALEALKLAKEYNPKACILKAKSPSCGKGEIYDGTFSGTLVKKNGITAKLLIENGYEVISEKEINKWSIL